MCAEHGVRHRILVVERDGNARLVAWGALNLREGALGEVPDVPLERQRIPVMAGGKVRVEPDRLAEKAESDLVLLRCVFVEVPKAALVGFPGIEAFRRLAQHALLLGLGQRGFDDPGDARGNLVLDGKDVAEVAVVAVGPDMSAGYRIDQLGR